MPALSRATLIGRGLKLKCVRSSWESKTRPGVGQRFSSLVQSRDPFFRLSLQIPLFLEVIHCCFSRVCPGWTAMPNFVWTHVNPCPLIQDFRHSR